jgi:hypothetical protein
MIKEIKMTRLSTFMKQGEKIEINIDKTSVLPYLEIKSIDDSNTIFFADNDQFKKFIYELTIKANMYLQKNEV